MIRIFYNSLISCQHCAYAVSFMERYEYEYKTIDISQPENKKEYQETEDILHELKEDIGILPYIMLNEDIGFTGFPSPETEYEILEYIQQIK